MKKQLAIIFTFFVMTGLSHAQVPKVAGGSIRRIENFPSKLVEPRNVDVWLPDGYNASKKYNVLYMHDGQMLFDSSSTWTKTEWKVDETMTALMKDKKIKDCIVVGIWNTGAGRHPDYFPQKPFESLPKSQQDSLYVANVQNGYALFNNTTVHSDNYLKFIVTELKPYIDTAFATLPAKENTFIMGSSMGGLISLYAICEYPDVFEGAGCLSTHWPGIFTFENNPVPEAFFNYMKTHLPDPKTHRIYFDYGDQTLDAHYPPLQAKADSIMKSKGYTSANWVTRFFPGENHSEVSWAKRLDIPLLFLLKK
jgi:predicted alpha/beta superfamily hydrolase